MLSLLYPILSVKWVVPSSFILGTAPNYFMYWSIWRFLSCFFPGARVFQTGDDMMYSLYQRVILFFFEHCTRANITFYGDIERIFANKENVILISNHQCTLDWMIADMLAVRQGSLGHIRYILKDTLKYFPLYGFYFRQHSCIYVKRSGLFKENRAIEQLDELSKNKYPFWMIVFPEGTRINDKNVHKSRKYAQKMGFPVLNNVLIPRHKATKLAIDRLRHVTDAVYDVTIAYSGPETKKKGGRLPPPGLVEFFKSKDQEVHIHVDRIDIHEVPYDDMEMQHWLRQRFVLKEKLLEDFYDKESENYGHLGDRKVKVPLLLRHTIPYMMVWTAVNAPVFFTETGRAVYWKSALMGTIFGWLWVQITV